MASRSVRRIVAGLLAASASAPAWAAAQHRSRAGIVLLLIIGVVALVIVARTANAQARLKRGIGPGRIYGRTSLFWRVVRYAALLIFLALAVRSCMRPRDYPDGWPWIRPVALGSHGHCPDIQGDYTDVDYLLGTKLGFASERDRWRDHHARLVQSADGRTIRVELGLNTNGMHAARGELKNPGGSWRYGGRAKSFVLREHVHYECQGRWIYSVSLHDSGNDFFRHVDARMTRDLRGGLIVGDTVEWSGSIGWGDSPRIPVGKTRQTRWSRYPPRPDWDAARVRELQTLTLHASPYRAGSRSAVVTSLVSRYDVPLCLRLEHIREWGGKFTRSFERIGRDEWSVPHAGRYICPKGSGVLDPISHVAPMMWEPSGGSREMYVLYWAPADARPLMWRTIRVEDVRELPGYAPPPREIRVQSSVRGG